MMSSGPPDVWGADTESEVRVRAVTEMLTRPRSAAWIAEQARVDHETARTHLSDLVEDGRLRTVERDRTTWYYPDLRAQFFDELGALVDEYTKAELTAELEAITRRIEAWQADYGVENVDELRTTLDESLRVEARRERERVVDAWAYNEEMRTLVRHAIRLYDDLHRLTATYTPARADIAREER